MPSPLLGEAKDTIVWLIDQTLGVLGMLDEEKLPKGLTPDFVLRITIEDESIGAKLHEALIVLGNGQYDRAKVMIRQARLDWQDKFLTDGN